MALSDRKKQAKKQRKQAKRKQSLATRAREGVASISARAVATQYARYPIHEAFYSDVLDQGISNVILSRRAPDGSIAAGVFLIDFYCLGVKNAFFALMEHESKYEEFKANLLASSPGVALRNLHPTCLRKMVEGAVDYARDLGFPPHKDYAQAAPMLGDIEAAACPERFEYGKDGKPMFISGPNDSPTRTRTILNTLERRCGTGNFEFIAFFDE